MVHLSSSADEQKKIVLNSGEELYAELRDKNFNAVGPVLSRKTKLLTAEFDVRYHYDIITCVRSGCYVLYIILD